MMGSDLMMAWVLAFAAAVCFGAMARRAGRVWLVWAIAGGVFSLVTATFVLGVATAAFIPLSAEACTAFRIKSVAAAAAIIAALGWLLTRNLHGQHRPLWEAVRKLFRRKS
jgi:hypothetical protein